MTPIPYVTSNQVKLRTANQVGKQFGLSFTENGLDIEEIQAEHGEPVARDKAAKAFEILKKPLVVSDDSWMIPGLKGFPGPYMKSMNHWFTAEDWLRLTLPLKDRRIILRQIVVFQHEHGQELFYTDVEGLLLKELGAKSDYPHLSVLSLDGGKTCTADIVNDKKSAIFEAGKHTSWHEFAEWYNTHYAKIAKA